MGYIKRLKLKGFKSFANPTVLNFEKGFNTVVGANGSGKSNVFDAMCFVLGRMSSRELRTEKLGNLVFNGGKNLKPSKDAEVSIYLNNENKELINTDLDEIKVTRVVNKDGQSKYLLNNVKVTRTEIVEILKRAGINPDGYNIILQGDIVRIVNMSTVERRELIEEISNISGYEEKREKAIKKLDKVELDLKDADLLMEEKTKYLKDLKSEKEQAEKYRKVKEDLRHDSLLLIKARILRNNSLKEKKKEELEKIESSLTDYKDKLEEFESQSKEIDSKISELEKSIEVKSHQDFISVTNKITSLESEIEKLKERKSEYKKDIEELKTKGVELQKNVNNNKKQIKEIELESTSLEKEKKVLEKDLQDCEKELVEFKKKISPGGFEELDELDSSIDEINAKKSDKLLIRQDNAIQIEKLNTKVDHLQEDLKRIDGMNDGNKEKLKELEVYRANLKKSILGISQLSNKNSEISSKLNNLQQEYSKLSEEHSKMSVKMNASKDILSTNRAVEAINRLKEKDPMIHGTVMDLANTSDKFGLALEKSAGRALFNVVVEDDKTAVKYIKYLKDQKIGSVTFLPLNKVNAKYKLDESVLQKKGAIDFALNILKFDKKYENIFHLIFGDTLIIENVEDARSIGIGNHRMVSMDGDLVAKSGAMTGGFSSRSKGLGAFKDDKLSDRVAQIDSKLGALSNTISLLKEEKEDNERELYDLRHNKIEIEGDVSKLEKILSIEGRDTGTINKEIEAVLSDKVVIESSLKKLDREISDLDQKLKDFHDKKNKIKSSTSQNGKGFENMSKLEEKRDSLKEKVVKLQNDIGSKNIQINNVLLPEIRNIEKIVKEGEVSLKELDLKLSENISRLKDLEVELKENKEKEKELSKGYKDLISKRDKFKEDKVKLELKYEKEFTKFDSIKEKASQARYSLNDYETLSKTLDEELENNYEQVKAEFLELGDEKLVEQKIKEILDLVEKRLNGSPIDVKELQSKVNSLKTRINSFGAINLKAVEIYDKLNEEFNLLLEKRETLNEEKSEILSFIAEIDEMKKVRFMETFNVLREHFVNIFSKLSTKGVVELNIENEKDLFNSGVEIKVKLSEKNYLDIKSLSGGEKTITAVAFIFAVQEFHPASFYLLDEIDAALDIMNSEKLGKLIKDYSSRAQYVVVSHSEYFIQSSEIIYGVTMDNNKISNVVSLDLRDTKDYLDEDANAPEVKS